MPILERNTAKALSTPALWLPLLAAAVAAIAASVDLSMQASAEAAYPNRPITIMVPYGPGGVGDVALRLYQTKLEPRLGQNLILEYHPGGGGAIAANATLARPADGYTLFFCGSGMAISMSLFKAKPFDIVNDFEQISTISRLDELLLATGVNSRFKTIGDLIDTARKQPGKITLGSINPGSTQNLTAHLFAQKTGIDVAIVPYKAVPDLITALIRGDVDLGVDYFAGFQPVANDNRIRILATTGEKRSVLLPDVPTVKESGYPDFVVSSWQGLAAPRGVPVSIVQYLNGEMVAAAADPEFRQRLLQTGQTPGGSSIEDVNASMRAEVAKWADVIAKSGIEVQ
jgi:tripartite-type tricarboxylate transporter receptor subunit TctC